MPLGKRRMLKAVVDTNQFISSLISKKGPSAKLIDAWRDYKFLLIISQDILTEMKRVFYYPRIITARHLNKQDIETFIAFIEKRATIVSHTPSVEAIKDDPDDNKILACALEAQADYIVSGDEHLLSLHQYQNIKVVTVREFLEILRHK